MNDIITIINKSKKEFIINQEYTDVIEINIAYNKLNLFCQNIKSSIPYLSIKIWDEYDI